VQIPVSVSALDRPAFDRTQLCLFLIKPGVKVNRHYCRDILLFQQMLDATKCVETWAEFPQSMVDDAINQWWKRQETCIHADGGHFEHLLWRYLRDVRVGTQQNQFFSQPPVPHNTLPFRSHQHLEGNNMPSFIRMSSAFHKILTFFKC